jgi:hypothetical protein
MDGWLSYFKKKYEKVFSVFGADALQNVSVFLTEAAEVNGVAPRETRLGGSETKVKEAG